MRTLLVICHVLLILFWGCSDEVSGTADENSVPPIVSESDIPPYWKQIRLKIKPGKRYFHAMAYDEDRKVTVLFGGAYPDAGSPLNDTWEYDGLDWIEISTGNKPHERNALAMTYDPCRKRVVMFGGIHSLTQAIYNDTWVYVGENENDTPAMISWTIVVLIGAFSVVFLLSLRYSNFKKRASSD